MRIFIHLPDEWGCGHYRAYYPYLNCFDKLRAHGVHLTCGHELHSEQICYDAYVFHRVPSPTLLPFVQELKSMGKKLVWTLDDDLWNIPADIPSQEAGFANRWFLDQALAIAHQIWVSTPHLASVVGRGARVLPNLVDPGAWLKPMERSNLIMFAGGSNHERDLAMLVEPMERILAEYPAVKFCYWGCCPEACIETCKKPGEFAAMARVHGKYGDRVLYQCGVPFARFHEGLALARPMIALCPLVDDAFNRSRSNLKWLEMTLAGAAVIASDVEPYRCIHDGVDGLLVGVDGWYDAIQRLIDDVWLREHLARTALHNVKACYSWQGNTSWVDAFLSLK